MENRLEDSQLDNILIDKDKGRFDKIKKAVLLIASLALLFTLTIIIIKILNQDEKVDEVASKLPTESLAQKDIKEPEPLFEKLPIKEEGNIDDKFDKIVSNIKSQAEAEMKTASGSVEKDVAKVDTSAQQMLFTPTPTPIATPKVVETPKTSAKTETTPIPTTQEVQPSSEASKSAKIAEDSTLSAEASAQKQSQFVTTADGAIPKGYYIQIGAFKNLKDTFLQSITQKGFNYQLERAGDVTKVLIGPYVDKVEAKVDLIKAQEQLSNTAYLTGKYNK